MRRTSNARIVCSNHRPNLILSLLAAILLIISMCFEASAAWTIAQKLGAGLLLVFLLVLIWYRAWQRAAYYVREVLLTAERVLDDRKSAKE